MADTSHALETERETGSVALSRKIFTLIEFEELKSSQIPTWFCCVECSKYYSTFYNFSDVLHLSFSNMYGFYPCFLN